MSDRRRQRRRRVVALTALPALTLQSAAACLSLLVALAVLPAQAHSTAATAVSAGATSAATSAATSNSTTSQTGAASAANVASPAAASATTASASSTAPSGAAATSPATSNATSTSTSGSARGNSESIQIRNARLVLGSDSSAWTLSADLSLPLPAKLEDAVNQGVALYFVVDLDIYRPRWYWWDERLLQISQTYRLSYHALTRQYRVTVNGFQNSYATLNEALRGLSSIRAWKVMDAERPRPGVQYEAYVRMRLDLAQLPKPFQITALTNRDWNLQAEWKRFNFSLETPKGGL